MSDYVRAFALLLLVAGVAAQEPQSQPQPQLDQVAQAEEPAAQPNVALLRATADMGHAQQIEELVVNATMSAAYSGCGLCQQTGRCDHAFRGAPGQFCLGMASGAPCCCPLDAQCVASPYECRCRRVVPTNRYDGNGDYHPQSEHSSGWGTFFFFIIVALCCCCCMKRAHRERQERYAYAQPVGSEYGTYPAAQQAPYAYASAPMAYESRGYHDNHTGGGNSMAAGAAGALGGLGVGAVLGSMFGGDRGSNNSGGQGGSSQYFAGDTGGATQNSSFFSGDTGGGNFGGDFGGDNGGDNTFSGDS